MVSGAFLLHCSSNQLMGKIQHKCCIIKDLEGIDRCIRMGVNQCIAFLKTVELDKRILDSIYTNCLAQFFRITDHVQHIVTDLEREA